MNGNSSCRDFLQRHTVSVTAVTLIVATFCLGSLVRRSDEPRYTSTQSYYMDMNTGVLFVADTSGRSVIDAPSGPLLDENGQPQETPAGVRAYVFSCSDCADKSSLFVGWLEKYERGSWDDDDGEDRDHEGEGWDGRRHNRDRELSAREPVQDRRSLAGIEGQPARNAVMGFGESRSEQGDGQERRRAARDGADGDDYRDSERRRRWREGRDADWDADWDDPERRGRHFVSQGAGEAWHPSWSDEASYIRMRVERICPGDRPATPCRPQ